MRFEARDLKPYAEPVSPDQLKEGTTYFAVNFADEDMLVPILEPKVFIGRNLDANEPGLYFQDFDSYRRGVRFVSPTAENEARFEIGAERHVFDYERALDVLMSCALRRRKAFGEG